MCNGCPSSHCYYAQFALDRGARHKSCANSELPVVGRYTFYGCMAKIVEPL